MRGGRLFMVVATLAAILVLPLLLRDALRSSQLPSAYAAQSAFDTGGRVYQNDNRNNDDDDDDNNRNDNNNNNDGDGDDDDNGDNDNRDVCYENLNSNEEVPCDFDNDNYYYDNDNHDNDNRYSAPPAPRRPRESVTGMTKCFDVGEVGVIQMAERDFDVTIAVVPNSNFGSVTRLTLNKVDPATVPAPPAGVTLLDSAVWSLDAQNGCDGGGISTLPSDVNLGIAYSVPADKSRLRIVRLEGGQWVEVNTVPDPSPTNPYISSTIRQAGIYAVVQR